ncbi:ArsR family transcriptional regulator [bacterium]|nr:ArsR family transcriptional regulator [bacterium]
MEKLEIRDFKAFKTIASALSGELRIRIIELLRSGGKNLHEIAAELEIPLSTATVSVQKLEEAGLLIVNFKPGIRGTQKICSLAFDKVSFILAEPSKPKVITETISMPVGKFTDSQVTVPCGICTAEKQLGSKDDIKVFFFPEKTEAQLVWFKTGFVEYRFPNPVSLGDLPISLCFSAELCSEVPFFNNFAKSDITLWINNVEIGAWRSPGDFGGKRGKLTPKWWGKHKTQYGRLATWQINKNGSTCNKKTISEVVPNLLSLDQAPFISVRLGVKTDAEYSQGVNIFGKLFGNFPQDLELTVEYQSRLV